MRGEACRAEGPSCPTGGDPADRRVILTQLGFRQEASTLSFFDEDDEPRRRTRRPRRATGGAVVTDSQTVLVRRLVADALALLVLVLLAVAVNSCLNSRQENALKDYTREVSSIATRVRTAGRAGVLQHAAPARQRVPAGPPDGDLWLPRPGRDPAPPGRGPRRPRRDGAGPALAADRAAVPARRARLHRRAHPARAGRPGRPGRGGRHPDRRADGGLPRLRRRLLRPRRCPLIRGVLDDNEVDGQQIARSQFLPGIEWIEPANVGEALGQQVTGGGDTGARTSASPPRACTAPASTPSRSATRRSSPARRRTACRPATTPPSRCASPTSGENDETDVKVDRHRRARERAADPRLAHDRHRPRGGRGDRRDPARHAPAAGRRHGPGARQPRARRGEGRQQRGEYDVGFVAP